MNGTIKRFVEERRTDWRFSDFYGLSERTLDCKQLVVKEVLQWQGETNLIPIFLDSLSCHFDGDSLKRNNSAIRGYSLVEKSAFAPDDLRSLVSNLFEKEGYCLIRYPAGEAMFSSYYKKYMISHWALVLDIQPEFVILMDTTGTSPYFEGQIGKVMWEYLPRHNCSAAIVRKEGDVRSWEHDFLGLVQDTLREMTNHGLHDLHQYISFISNLSVSEIVQRLERMELEVHSFRQVRELWNTAIRKQSIPPIYIMAGWIEEFEYVCRAWSLVLGVLMKWKRQPERNYKQKLMDYLEPTYRSEKSLINELEQVLLKRGS